MAVHHRDDIRADFIDFAVDEPLQVRRPPVGVHRVAVEVVFDDVVGGHQGRRHAARQQIAVGVLGMTHADMAEPVDDVLIVQDAVARHEIVDQRGIGGAGGGRVVPACADSAIAKATLARSARRPRPLGR
jgi:hypothetical protein